MKKLLLIEPASRLKYHKYRVRYFENVANRHYFKMPSLALGVLAGLTPPEWEIEIIREAVHLDGNFSSLGVLQHIAQNFRNNRIDLNFE